VALLIACAAGLFAMLVAWGRAHNWGVFLQFLYRALWRKYYSMTSTSRSISSLPAHVVVKIDADHAVPERALAGAVYLVYGDIEFNAQRRSMSPRAIAHGPCCSAASSR
jgi:hypothetical protein